ncbi:MAG: tetratricopeptide repeat protein [Acidobacteriia bacterium]|nr:tetratricopeptide repeat protein [Terriglobia bacterium]
MRSLVAVFVMLLAAGVACSQDTLSDADKAFRSADFKAAAKLYAAAAENEADSGKRADIRIRLAVTYFNMKNRAKAEEAAVAALKDNPQLELVPDFYTTDFLALISRVKTRLTAGTAPPPVRTAPAGSLAQVRQRLAQATDNAGVEALIPSLEALEASVPATQLVDVLEVKSDALDRLGRTGDALELRGRSASMRAAAQTSPGTSPMPLEALLEARRLIAAGRPLDAISLLHGVLSAAPSCFPAFEVLAEAYLVAGKLDDANNALRTALLGNQKPELLLLLGEVELGRGNLTGARDAFRRAVEIDSGNDRAWASLGLLAAHMGDLASARETLDKALSANGMLFEARVVRAQLALADGRPSEALAHLQRALQAKPDDPWASGWLGATYLASGNVAGTAEKLALAVKGGQTQFSLALVEAQRRSAKVEDALSTLAAAKSDTTTAGVLRARCLLDAGRPVEAQEVLQALVTSDPESVEARYLLGYALHAQRQWAAASRELARAAAMRNSTPLMRGGAQLAEATRLAQEVLDSAVTPPPPPAHR